MEVHSIVQRPTLIDVDLRRLTDNVALIRKQARGRAIMPIIKANAYGHGLVPVARHLEKIGVEQLGVAFVEEGVELRRAGITIPILVLGGIFAIQIEYFFDYDLEITVSSLDKLRQVERIAEKTGRKADIHLKIDTGMERIGVHSETCGPFIAAAFASPHCIVKGVYSHLACADDPDDPTTMVQVKRFRTVIDHIKKTGAPMPLLHLANSGGILHFPDTLFDMVRPGILIYGIYPSPVSRRILDVKPLLSLQSQVVYFKVVRKGRSVSYGSTWTAERDTRVVTVPIGYGDGYRRALSGCGEVLIRGKRYPIVGRVCMDQFMVDIGLDSAYNGDEVVLIGCRGDECITTEEMAALVGTIPYEILTALNDRIPRVYVD